MKVCLGNQFKTYPLSQHVFNFAYCRQGMQLQEYREAIWKCRVEHTHFVMSQSCLTGSFNKWTTLALGGLEARKHEQREDSALVNGW